MPTVLPDHLRGLLVDESSLPIPEAVASHLGQRQAWYGDLLTSLAVRESQLPQLTAVGPPVAVTVVVSGGAGALEPAVRWAATAAVELRGLQVTMRESDAGDLAPNARRICAALDALLASGDLVEDVPVYVEAPALHEDPPASWLGALDEVAAAGHRAAFRTGAPGPVPGSDAIARCIAAALDRELAFGALGGAGRAVRQPGVGHGFLNLLLATRASLDGASTPDVAAVLDEVDPGVLIGSVGAAGLAGAHRWFTTVSCPDVARSVADLVELGLVSDPGTA